MAKLKKMWKQEWDKIDVLDWVFRDDGTTHYVQEIEENIKKGVKEFIKNMSET